MTYPEDIMEAAREVARGCVERPYNKGTLAKAEARIAAALLAERKAKVKVKPLKWEEDKAYLEESAEASAVSPFGRRYFVSGNCYWGPGIIASTGHANLEAAKSAAQADYDRRILSAIMGGGDE